MAATAERCTIYCDRDSQAGNADRLSDELIVWLVTLLFLPFVIYERWRRFRQRHSATGLARDRAVQHLLRKLNVRLREMRREDAIA